MQTALLALLASVFYATVRYNVFKGVPWADWSTYTLNKALALAAILLLTVSVIRKRRAESGSQARVLEMAAVFTALHVAVSLTLLSPAYYETFFRNGKLTAAAGLSMTLGSVGAVAMVVIARVSAHRSSDRGIRSLALLTFVIGLHAMLPGLAGWFAPATWPGMMPPITLISFVLGLTAAAAALLPTRSK